VCVHENAEEESKVRRDIQTHQMGILSHVMERIRANEDMPVPYLETVSSFLRTLCQDNANEGTSGQDVKMDAGGDIFSSYGRNCALALIQVGLSHCHNNNNNNSDDQRKRDLIHAVLASSLVAVDYFYEACRRMCCTKREGTAAERGTAAREDGHGVDIKKATEVLYTPLFNASWIVLDCVCILSGTRPLWEECNEEVYSTINSESGKSTSSPEADHSEDRSGASDVAPSHDSGNTGVFDLFLDVLLYHLGGSSSALRGRGRWERRIDPVAAFMSSIGAERIHHRIKLLVSGVSRLADVDVTNLKLACLAYAAGPVGRANFFRGVVTTTTPTPEMGIGETQTLILLVLTGYGTYTSKVGRAARSYLDVYINRQKILKEKKGKFISASKEICTVGMACSLLILTLGDDAAGPILEKYIDCRDVWESILGLRPVSINREVNQATDIDRRNENTENAMEVGDERTDGVGYDGTVAMVADDLGMELIDEDDVNNIDIDDNMEDGTLQNNITNGRNDDNASVTNFTRGPLPPNAAASAIDFVTRYLISSDDSASSNSIFSRDRRGKNEACLLVDLAIRAGEHALGLGQLNGRRQDVDHTENLIQTLQEGAVSTLSAGARIIRAFSDQLLSYKVSEVKGGSLDLPWVDASCRQCLSTAIKVLSTVPSMELAQTGRVWDNEEGPRQQQPWAAGRAAIIQHHRQMRRRRMGPALLPEGVRVEFYDLIRHFARNGMVSLDKKVFSFAIPILLFRCLVKEETKVHGNITAALNSLLGAYKKLLRRKGWCGSHLAEATNVSKFSSDCNHQHLVAPILPPLLSAACSESHTVKLAAVSWSSEIILLLDPLAAQHLCSFLADDADRDISKIAKEVIAHGMTMTKRINDTTCSAENEDCMGKSVVMFLDSSNDMDKDVLHAKLDFEVSALSAEVNIPKSAASILLRHFKFSRSNAVKVLRSDRDGTLKRCGIVARCHSKNAFSSEQSMPPDTTTKHTCGICFDDDFSAKEMFSLPCGHEFCSGCFRTYIEIQFDESPTAILDCTCPSANCHERVTEEEVAELTPNRLGTWENQRFASFIDLEPHHRWCPGPDCKMIGISDMASGTAKCVGCDTNFCFACGEQAHPPATCAEFERWNKVFSSSQCWIAKNSKPCPGCNVPVEKDTGCNHMHCSRCDSHFCWVCLSFIGGYGDLSTHICNKYDPAKHQTSKSRDIFYVLRFQAHDEAEKFAKQNITDNRNMKWMEDGPFCFSAEEKNTFKEAAESLVECRHFLKFSYIIAYSILDNPKKRVAFEKQQGALEMLTEKLSGLTEVNLETLCSWEGERALHIHLKALAFHTLSVKKYAERMRRSSY